MHDDDCDGCPDCLAIIDRLVPITIIAWINWDPEKCGGWINFFAGHPLYMQVGYVLWN